MSWNIYHGDCREVMATLHAESVDAVVTSPPYAMQRAKQYGGIPDNEYPDWTVAWMSDVHRLLSPSGSVIINIREHVKGGQISDYVHHTRLALRAYGWFEWDELVWIKKTSAPIGHQGRPRRSWERLLWFGKSRQGFSSPKANGKESNRVGRAGSKRGMYFGQEGAVTGGLRNGVSRCPDFIVCNPEHSQNHPAPYPVDLARWCIKLITPPGGVVLDPFTGSGSTGKGATLEGFRFIGIEREAEYVEIAKARIAAVEAGAGSLFT